MEPGDQRLTPVAPAYVNVGRIGRAHGVRGEVRVSVLTDFPEERFAPGNHLYLGREQDPEPELVEVVSVRPHRDVLLVRLDVASTRTEAANLVGLYLCLPVTDVMPLGEDAYYEHELVGLLVVTDTGEVVGHVAHVIETGSVPVLQVGAESGRAYFVPMTGENIASIVVDDGRITITPLPGLLD